MSKKRVIWTVVIIVAVGLLLAPKFWPKQNEVKSGKPSGAFAPVNVGVYIVKKEQQQNTIQAVGNIMAEDEVELKSETQGRIVKLNFSEGQEVTKGQLLVKMNDAELQAQLKKAISTQKLKNETARRNTTLLEKGGISQEEYEIAITDLNSANADIDLLKEQIRKTQIVAPFNGLIGLRSISEGAYLTNATVIARLQSLNRVKIEFSIPEKYATFIGKGSKIQFTVEGQPKQFEAAVYAIEPKIDPVTRNMVVRAICDNPKRMLMPGAFAKITVSLSSNPNAFMIPTQAVVPILKGQKVFVVKGDSVIEQKIAIGMRNELNVEVTDGLKAGDSVVVQGVIQMKQGAKIKVVKSAEVPPAENK